MATTVQLLVMLVLDIDTIKYENKYNLKVIRCFIITNVRNIYDVK